MKRREKPLMRNHMKTSKKKKLERKGWKVGSVTKFLQLSPEESAYIEMKLALSKTLQDRRKGKNLTQEQLARLLKSSQSRVAKMEAGDPSVSFDLLVRSLLILGESRKTLAKMLSEPRSAFVS
jgi:DNA-binding transcriptional regulator YiaG